MIDETVAARRPRGYPRKLMGTVATILVLGAVAVLLVGCTGSSTNTGASKTGAAGGVLTVGLSGSGSSLDPGIDTLGATQAVRALAYEPLIYIDPSTGNSLPALATSWQYLGTGNKSFELRLREGARFADGSPVNAEAVKVWLTYWSAKNPFSSIVGKIDNITTTGQYIVTIDLNLPNPNLPYLLSEQFSAGAVASPNSVEHPSDLASGTNGAGPYVADRSQTQPGDHYTYVPNDYYFNKSKIAFSKVIVKVISNTTTMLQAATTGQVDVASGDVATADAAAGAGLTVSAASGQTWGLAFTDIGGKIASPLNDVRVRRALNYAVDRAAIVSAIFGKYATPRSEIFTVDGYDPNFENYYNYDPVKARTLLAEAGYPDGFTVRALTCSCFGNQGTPFAQAMSKYFEAVGVNLDIVSATTSTEYNKTGLSGTYAAVFGGSSFPMTRGVYSTWLGVNSPLNFAHYDQRPLEMAYQLGAAAQDPSIDFRAMWREATQDGRWVIVGTLSTLWYSAKNIGGVGISNKVQFPVATAWYRK